MTSIWSDLTLVTCALKFHDPFLNTTYKFLRESSTEVIWKIINNDLHDKNLNVESYLKLDGRLEVTRGPKINPNHGVYAPGLQHSHALSLAIETIKTKYTIILDPDFVIFDWVSILDFCHKEIKLGKDIIGTPWFPTWFNKRLDTIAPHFVFAQTSVLTKDFIWYPNSPVNQPKLKPKEVTKILRLIKRLANQLLLNRRLINKDSDTFCGSSSFVRKGKATMLTPIVSRDQLAKISPHLKFSIGRKIERIVPKQYRYLRNAYQINVGGLKSGALNLEPWSASNSIFGIHNRSFSTRKGSNEYGDTFEEFDSALEQLSEKKMNLLYNLA